MQSCEYYCHALNAASTQSCVLQVTDQGHLVYVTFQIFLLEREIRGLLSNPSEYGERMTSLLQRIYPEVFDDDTDLTTADGLSDAAINWLSENDVTTDNVQGLVDALADGSQDAALDVATAFLRAELCEDRQNEYVLLFDDDQLGQRVVDELCNLTYAQFELLVTDFYNDVSNDSLEQVRTCNIFNACLQHIALDACLFLFDISSTNALSVTTRMV